MSIIETWTTDDGATVEVHDTPWEGHKGDGTNLGHLRAYNDLASTILPVSKALLDDNAAVKHYVKTRLLLFLQLETDRVKTESGGVTP